MSAVVEVFQIHGDLYLYIDRVLWMWRNEAEIADQEAVAAQAHGDVLLAGYGFGLCQKALLENPKVRSVLTVELYQGVIDAAKTHIGRIYGNVLVADFFRCHPARTFDCVIGDIWQEITPTHLPTWLKFRERAKTLLKPGGKILGWGAEFFEWLAARKGL